MTTPLEGILVSREKLESGPLRTLGEFANLVDEVVAFGTHVLSWSLDAMAGKAGSSLPAVILFRRGLEVADGIGMMIRGSAHDKVHGGPCVPDSCVLPAEKGLSCLPRA